MSHLRVSLPLIRSSELAAASRTLERFLARVSAHVSSEMVGAREGAMTDVALQISIGLEILEALIQM